MPQVVWKGKDFSMRPVDPASAGDNPVTRVLNMVLRGDDVVTKRQVMGGTGIDAQTTIHNVAFIDGQDYLFIKSGTTVKYSTNGTSFTSVGFPSSIDPVIGGVSTSARGSFSSSAGEMYYCDKDTIFAWPGHAGVGSSNVRRPGVPSLDTEDYVTMKLAKGLGTGQASYDSVAPPFGTGETHPCGVAAAGSHPARRCWPPLPP